LTQVKASTQDLYVRTVRADVFAHAYGPIRIYGSCEPVLNG